MPTKVTDEGSIDCQAAEVPTEGYHANATDICVEVIVTNHDKGNNSAKQSAKSCLKNNEKMPNSCTTMVTKGESSGCKEQSDDGHGANISRYNM